MNFDRALADAQFVRDHLVRLARYDEIEDFAFTIGQAVESLRNLGMLLLLFAAFGIGLQGLANAVQQVLVAERLLDEVDCALLHRIDGHRHVAMSRDENYR